MQGVDMFASGGVFLLFMSPSSTSRSSRPHMRRKYSVKSPLARPPCLKNIFTRRPEEREADVSQNTTGHYLSSGGSRPLCQEPSHRLLREHQRHRRLFRRILRQRRLAGSDNTLAGGGHAAPPTSLAPSKGPKPRLAISFIRPPPVSGPDWALCLSRNVLATLCLNSVPLKPMENVLIPPHVCQCAAAVNGGIPEL